MALRNRQAMAVMRTIRKKSIDGVSGPSMKAYTLKKSITKPVKAMANTRSETRAKCQSLR
jgi:hypothetical protein